MKMPQKHRIALLLNANKAFDRAVITGVASYLASTRVAWELFMEEDFRCRLDGLESWKGDGIIADLDDPATEEALAHTAIPVVGVGGSRHSEADYPANVPFVATDNAKLVETAYNHMVAVGLPRFALFGVPASPAGRCAQERERAFTLLMKRDRLALEVYRGHATSAAQWQQAQEELVAWLEGLPKPVGIIAVDDARARQVLQACVLAGIPVPEQVALIGIGDDPLVRALCRSPLTSVMHSGEEVGRAAAQMLHQKMGGGRAAASRIVVPPAGINVQATCRHEAAKHPHVMRARHFIRQYACQGIKTEQVADYVGVSRSSLESYFRLELGRSVHDEILRFKLDAATAILARERCSIADVAISCGFTSVQYMHAVFKRELGCTPRKYQDRMLAEAGMPPVAGGDVDNDVDSEGDGEAEGESGFELGTEEV